MPFGYKSCVSFTNVAFRVQKLRFAYKNLVFNLQNCISNYKDASRNAIHHLKIHITSAKLHDILQYEKNLSKNNKKLLQNDFESAMLYSRKRNAVKITNNYMEIVLKKKEIFYEG